jgi:hypothetical protein
MYQTDLELPHVPHMTTITTSVVATEKLARWRAKHPERYKFVLSDSTPLPDRLSSEHSCIRNRKAWFIDNTFYVSSRSEGTLPLHNPNPQEFHEMQWRMEYSSTGRLVDEREVTVLSPGRGSESTPPGTSETKSSSSLKKNFRASLSRSSLLHKIVDTISNQKKEPEHEQRRRS